MRDISRTQLCTDEVDEFSKCSRDLGLAYVFKCRSERDCLVSCIQKWFLDPEFKEMVTLEFLNERSHFRQTGIQTKRYTHGTFIHRDLERDGPPLNAKKEYRPQKPKVIIHLFTFCLHFVYILFTFCFILFTFCLHFVYILFTFCLHFVYISFTFG
jgi:hypothetical protein